ncbi:hypothetical protein SpCBS45565_g02634 [Spizellomyces sp. 'palustris']|nr:hypothetical protein SpCBS45565_g02634 [Spizellomyces sp. 'palustris']
MRLLQTSVALCALAATAVTAQQGNTTQPANPPPAGGNSTAPGVSCGVQNDWNRIETQAQLAQLVGTNCTNILGSVLLAGPGITDLTPLAKIESVQLSIDIASTNLRTLTGLGNLKTVGENLFIHDNAQLSNVFGLNSLTTIQGGVLVYQNPQLVSIAGLATMTNINPDKSPKFAFGISVYGNPVLAALDGLQNLKTVGNVVIISNNTRLNSLDNLPSTGPFPVQSITIERLPVIKTLAPLSVFTSAANGTALKVTTCDSLTSLDGISLASVTNLTLTHNAALADVKAIGNSKIAGPIVQVDDNTKLCDLSPVQTAAGGVSGAQILNTCGKPQQQTGGSSTAGGANSGGFPGGPNMPLPGSGSFRSEAGFTLVTAAVGLLGTVFAF